MSENPKNLPEKASPGDGEPKLTVIEVSARIVAEQQRFASFKNRVMLMKRDPFPHYEALHDDEFARLAYPLLGGVTRGRVKDVQAFIGAVAEDLSQHDHMILFGKEEPGEDEYYHSQAATVAWDTRTLEMVEVTPELADSCVWRSPYGRISMPPVNGKRARLPFVMSLAGGDLGLYDDIMQSMAPMIMQRKPDGVIWWVGDGANGKSTLMDALYKLFPGQLASLTVATLTANKDTPFLNGNLANIVKESSEGRIEDTEIYKAIGTHEDFRTHKFHSQETYLINGNMHHVFSANTIPTFNDKGFSARRRTFIVPFLQRFESDPLFEERTFTAEMFGHLISELMYYAKAIAGRGYKYKWSKATLDAKLEYDSSANNAEEYARHIIREGLVAFESFNSIKIDYDNWCADEGYVPLGVSNMRRAILSSGFERVSAKANGSATVRKIYRLPTTKAAGDLIPMGMGRPGMYTIAGFRPADEEELEPVVPDFAQPPAPDPDDAPPEPLPEEKPEEPTEPPPKSVLNNRW